MQKGSVLILTLIAVVILSMMAMTGLTISTIESHTTQNYYINKTAYYTAVEGVEEIRESIFTNPEWEAVTAIVRSISGTEKVENNMKRAYITGSLEDLEGNSPKSITAFMGFDPPPFPSISQGTKLSIQPVIWNVYITSEITQRNKKSYSEIITGVYSTLPSKY